MTPTRIFLATDFGLDDEFVGVVHGVLARLAPEVRVIDLSHGIAPFDVAGGAALLERAVPHLGEGVVVGVVDPGVGSARRALAIEVGGSGPRYLVGPDNGLLLGAASLLGGPVRAVALARRDAVSTFDGRDVFAPCAAALATGVELSSLGATVALDSIQRLAPRPIERRELDDGRTALVAHVAWIDRFGNVQLTARGEVLEPATAVWHRTAASDSPLHVVHAYAELAGGAIGVLRDANDAVAIVVGEGSAARALDVAVGDRVELLLAAGPLR